MKILLILRLAVVLLLAFVAMRPTAIRPEETGPSDWAVLVDSSGSMRVKDTAERLEKAKELAGQALDSLGRKGVLFQFNKDATALKREDLAALKPHGAGSDLSTSLRSVFNDTNVR